MGRLVVSVLVSVDGYYEGAGKDLAPMPFDDGFNAHNLALLRRTGTLVYGSTWFEDNWNAWSTVADDDSQSDRDHEIARLVLSMQGLVVSDSMTVDPNAPWAATTRVIDRADAAREIADIKRDQDSDLLMFGSATTWNPLLEQGLVDELIVLVGPAVLGSGSSVYSGSRVGLRLIDAQVLPDSALVRLRYAPEPSHPTSGR